MPEVPEPLEFQRILRDAASGCMSGRGAGKVLGLLPADTPENALALERETLQAGELVGRGLHPPVSRAGSLEESLEALERGTLALEPARLRDIGMAALEFAGFRAAAGAPGLPEPPLESLLAGLPSLEGLSSHLLSITTDDGEVSPRATPRYGKLMVQADRLRREMSSRVAHVASRLAAAGALRDSPPSVRNGRFVLPVASGKRGAVAGIIHDRSDSGSTLYIEPAELVEQGNALQEAEVELQRERRRILRDATAMVRRDSQALEKGLESATDIDAVFARALYHSREETVFPGEGPMRLLGLRHPLIDRERVVQSDLALPGDWRVLVISGPNAGGKSVLMKAAALASVMARAGLGACVDPGSSMPFFTRVMVSMGDNQSIADQLSTYSARLSEQREMLEKADGSSLLVIDEPAAGTDPSTGAALAAALLTELASRDSRVLVSTHMGQLKKMALETPGFLNGSLSFDRETLTPAYSFVFGVPGASFTLEAARAAGIPGEVIGRAGELAGDSYRLDNLLASLTELNESRARETESLKLQRSLEAEAEGIRRQRHLEAMADLEALGKTLEEEYLRRLREINSRADSLLAVISRSGGDPGEAREARKAIREIAGGGPQAPRTPSSGVRETPARSAAPGPGDWVGIKGWNQPGRVESVSGSTARVRSGSFLLSMPMDSLTPAKAPEPAAPGVSQWDPIPVSPEVNLLGMTVDDAIGELDERMDNASASGLFRLRVVHGKGALMAGVTAWLRRDRRVRSVTQASPAEGGTGASIVMLKEGP
jgi:DNA mismatch repair protein MutS2